MTDLMMAESVAVGIGIIVGLIGLMALILMILDEYRIRLQQKEEKE